MLTVNLCQGTPRLMEASVLLSVLSHGWKIYVTAVRAGDLQGRSSCCKDHRQISALGSVLQPKWKRSAMRGTISSGVVHRLTKDYAKYVGPSPWKWVGESRFVVGRWGAPEPACTCESPRC